MCRDAGTLAVQHNKFVNLGLLGEIKEKAITMKVSVVKFKKTCGTSLSLCMHNMRITYVVILMLCMHKLNELNKCAQLPHENETLE